MIDDEKTSDGVSSSPGQGHAEGTESTGKSGASRQPAQLVDDIAHTNGDETIEELEKRKLRLELLSLAKPWWHRPQSIAAIIGLTVALGGWIVTTIYSNIDSKLELLGLVEQIEALEKEGDSLIASLKQKEAKTDPSTSPELFGQVSDESNGSPIAGAVIEALPEAQGMGVARATTDANGKYTLLVPKAEKLQLVARSAGYDPAYQNVSLEGDRKEVNVTLRRRAIHIQSH